MQIQRIHFKSVNSTQTYAKDLLNSDQILKDNIYMITAEQQTSSYGKNGSTWHSMRGNLLVSYAIPASFIQTKDNICNIAAATALGVSQSLSQHKVKTKIKWYNDIMIDCSTTHDNNLHYTSDFSKYISCTYYDRIHDQMNHFWNKIPHNVASRALLNYVECNKNFTPLKFMRYKKIGGLLIEKIRTSNGTFFVIGVGINIASSPNLPHTTHIQHIHTNMHLSVNELYYCFLHNIFKNLNQNRDIVHQQYKQQLAYIDHIIRFYNAKKAIFCKFISVDKWYRPIVSINNKIHTLSYDYRISY